LTVNPNHLPILGEASSSNRALKQKQFCHDCLATYSMRYKDNDPV